MGVTSWAGRLAVPWLIVAVAAATAETLTAQEEPTLPADLAADTRRALEAELARAEADGLPVRPLVLKVLEGRSKGAAGDRIVAAVGALRQRLAVAADVLGRSRSEDVLVAAAGAVYVGASPESLQELGDRTRDEALGMALVVLGDLVRRGVPAADATAAVTSLGAAGADATTFSEFRRSVDDDIRAGLAPASAAQVRLRGFLVRVGGSGGE